MINSETENGNRLKLKRDMVSKKRMCLLFHKQGDNPPPKVSLIHCLLINLPPTIPTKCQASCLALFLYLLV